ncbi:MAG: hypothetical protein GX616_16175 [Planctomycetes bacterium]|nr:hypothetical protein [Planctomycetota bacterium]
MRERLHGFVANGVTHVRDMGGPIDVLQEISTRIARGEVSGPRIFYAGPMIEKAPLFWEANNKTLPGFSVAINGVSDVDRLLPELSQKGSTMVKTFNKWDRRVYSHLTTTAERLSFLVVHDPGIDMFHDVPMDVAIDLGVTSIEHAKAVWPLVLNKELRREYEVRGTAPAPCSSQSRCRWRADRC